MVHVYDWRVDAELAYTLRIHLSEAQPIETGTYCYQKIEGSYGNKPTTYQNLVGKFLGKEIMTTQLSYEITLNGKTPRRSQRQFQIPHGHVNTNELLKTYGVP